ncbi:FAD-binding protein [Salmonella enterica subsp. enterica]|uniref:FAD-binding protein n=1 Tax=Salmonella enterica I TaxID=59201 RepID=A0A3S4IUJ4_SALET|nr:FAD-binding protein [Salmonella enterica subsp. enterica]
MRAPYPSRRSIPKVLNLAREDIVWHSVSELITDVPDKEMLGLNIVEFAGDDESAY